MRKGNLAKSTPCLNKDPINYRSTDNLLRATAQPSPHPIGSEELNYLKALCSVINEKCMEIGLPIKERWVIKDLESLSSEEMLRLVVFITKDIKGQTANVKATNIKPLQIAQAIGLGPVPFNHGPFDVYHHVKEVFPKDDSLFHFSVLIMPANDPKRTKRVLSYLMQFTLFGEDLVRKHLVDCYDEAVAEMKEKVEILSKIDELQKKIDDFFQTKKANLLRIPLYHKELETIRGNTRKCQNDLVIKEGTLREKRLAYENKQQEVDLLKQNAELLSLEIANLEDQVVKNSELIIGEFDKLKNKYTAEMAKREEYNCRKRFEMDRTAFLSKLCKETDKIFKKLEEFTVIQDSVISKRSLINNSIGKAAKRDEIRRAERKNSELRKGHKEMLGKLNALRESQAKELTDLCDEIDKTKEEIPQVKQTTVETRKQSVTGRKIIDEKTTELYKVQATLISLREVLKTLTKKFTEEPQKAEAFIQKVKEKIADNYPDLYFNGA